MALPTEDMVRYASGQVAVGGGKLRDATQASFNFDNGAQLKHTLMRSPNGFVIGVKDCNGQIVVEVPETGPERDYFGDIDKGKVVKLQYEIPTLNIEFEGVYKSIAGQLQTGQAVVLTIGWIGKMKQGVLF